MAGYAVGSDPPCTLLDVLRRSDGYRLVVAGPNRREQPNPPVPRATVVGPAPRWSGRDRDPIGGCAESASTGIDQDRGGPLRTMEVTMIDDVQWFVGIDWATQSHRVCLLDVEGRHVNERDFAHCGAGLTELRDWLLEKTRPHRNRLQWRSRPRTARSWKCCSITPSWSSPSIPSSSIVSAIASRSLAPRMTAVTPVCSAALCAPTARPSANWSSMIPW